MEKQAKEDLRRKVGERVAVSIARMIIRLQMAWSVKMGRFTGRYSTGKQKTFFICFFALMLTGNAWLTLSALRKGKALDPAPEIAAIPLRPIHKARPDRDTTGLYRAEKFLLWFDGQETTAKGRGTRDSIATGRPGLVDSVRSWVKTIKENAAR